MKQGATLTKFIFLMLLLAMLAYGACAAFSAAEKSCTTVAAITYEVGDGFQATGFVVRNETVLSAPSGINVLLCDEGARVAKGEALAATFADADAQKTQLRIDELTASLEQLDSVLTITPEMQTAAPEGQIHSRLLSLSAHIARGNLPSASGDAGELKTLLLQFYLDDAGRSFMQSQSLALKEEMAALRAQLSGAVTQCVAQSAGYFSGSIDGYESLLTAKSILTMSPSQLEGLSGKALQTSSTTLGRLITDSQWYFVCTAPQEKLAALRIGDRLTGQFAFDPAQTLRLQVVRISDPEDGKQVLVLSCADHMADISCLRTQAADILLRNYSGIRVPRSAIRFEGGSAGVYILEGAVAKWKPVKIIYEAPDYFLVEQNKSSTNNLWPGDELLLTAGELTEGQVIE